MTSMISRELSLDDALCVIRDLQSQIEELGSASHDYETELEGMIKKLELQVKEKDKVIQSLKSNEPSVCYQKQITSLEVQIDDLESENCALRSRLGALQSENDSVIEQNVLLQHEISDLKQKTKKPAEKPSHSSESHIPSCSSTPNSVRKPVIASQLKVSSNQSSLRISPHKSTADINITHLSTTSILATTNHK